MTAPAFRNVVESHGSGSTSLVVTTPTYVNGDLLVVAFGFPYPGETLSTLAGWTYQGTASGGTTGGGSAGYMQVYTKIANGDGVSSTWAASGTGAWHALMASYSNVDQTTPFDVAATNVTQGASASSTAPASGVTTSHNNETVLTFTRYLNNSAFTPCASPSMNSRIATYDASVGIGTTIALADYTASSAGATGSLNASIGTSAKNHSCTIAINPVLITPQFWTDFIKCAEVDS